MADCSKTEVFISEWNRMHDSFAGCSGCGLYNEYFTCIHYVMGNPKKAKEIVQKWSDEHPEPKPKTYADVFFEMLPNALKTSHGVPTGVCRKVVFEGKLCRPKRDCEDCWLEPYPEQEQEVTV